MQHARIKPPEFTVWAMTCNVGGCLLVETIAPYSVVLPALRTNNAACYGGDELNHLKFKKVLLQFTDRL